MLTKKKHSIYTSGLITGKVTFPVQKNKRINLPLLFSKLKELKYLDIKYDDTWNSGTPSFIHITLIGTKNSFNIFSSGKATTFHNIAPDAWERFLDFFYLEFIRQCLEERLE